MKRSQLLCALLALCLVLSWIPGPAAAAETGNISWTFDEAAGTLNISGTGAIPDYTVEEGAPWQNHSADITSVVISEGITGVGNRAFSGHYTGITSVILPSTLTRIGDMAFACCMGLTSIEFPSGLKEIGDSAFTQCYALTRIDIPGTVSHIGASAFSMCYGLSEVAIPSGTVSIGKGAFAECSNLSTVTFSETVKEIGQIAFAATGLVDVTVPENVEKIGSNAFGGCQKLKNVTILNPDCALEEYILGEEGTTATVSGFAGSTAESHAASCQYSFKLLDLCQLNGGHTYTQVGTAATCEGKGFTTYTCSVCGHGYEDSFIDALGHSFGDWVQTKAPTTTATGIAERTCGRCGEKEEMEIPKLDPEPTDPTEQTTPPTEVTDPTDAPTDPTEEPTDPTDDPTEPETEPPTEPDPTEPTDFPQPPKKSSPWGWIIAILLLLAAGGGGAAWYFLIYRKQQEYDDFDETEAPDEDKTE